MGKTNDPLKQWLVDFLASRLEARRIEGKGSPYTNLGSTGTTSPRGEDALANGLGRSASVRNRRPK
jgi:hypothetical protein